MQRGDPRCPFSRIQSGQACRNKDLAGRIQPEACVGDCSLSWTTRGHESGICLNHRASPPRWFSLVSRNPASSVLVTSIITFASGQVIRTITITQWPFYSSLLSRVARAVVLLGSLVSTRPTISFSLEILSRAPFYWTKLPHLIQIRRVGLTLSLPLRKLLTPYINRLNKFLEVNQIPLACQTLTLSL